MKIKGLDYMMKNNFLREYLMKIEYFLNDNDYQKAYQTSQLLMNYVNLEFIKKKYDMTPKVSETVELIKIYMEKEPHLAELLVRVNDKYIFCSEKDIEKEDVQEVLEILEEIYEYMENEYNIKNMFT